VDREEDLAFVRTVFAHFGTWRFTWQEVLQALADHPEWLAINRHVRQKTVP
jgi:spore coat polysaccharide biosynthesis protein SpsF